MKENNIAIAILLVATIVLLFKQNTDTVSRLTSIKESTDQILAMATEPVQRSAPAPAIQRSAVWTPIVYSWPSQELETDSWQSVVEPAAAAEGDSPWGKETEKRLRELEIDFKQSDNLHTSHDRRLDAIESKLELLEQLCSTSAVTSKRSSTSKSKAAAAAAEPGHKLDLLSIDEPAPPPIFIEHPQPQQVVFYSQPFYQPPVYSSPLTYGSTGSHAMAAASPSYGSMSYGMGLGMGQTYQGRRSVQQTRTTSYSRISGTRSRLGSRVGNFFGGRDCPGGVCPQ